MIFRLAMKYQYLFIQNHHSADLLLVSFASATVTRTAVVSLPVDRVSAQVRCVTIIVVSAAFGRTLQRYGSSR